MSFLARETNGKAYKSHKYCFDDVKMPTIKYDDKDNISFSNDTIGETNTTIKRPVSLEKKALVYQKNGDKLFKYFLDGSRRTYKVDDIAYGKRIYPIVAGQIGVACCSRSEVGKLKREILEHHLVLALPDCANKDGKYTKLFFNRQKEQLNKLHLLKKHKISFSEILIYKDIELEIGQKYENKGIAKIQDKMIELEKKIVKDLVSSKKLGYDDYLLKDGSLEYPEVGKEVKELSWAKMKNAYKSVVGVSKSFNPELCKTKRNKSIAKDIADLPLFHRTPAYKYNYQDNLFSVWYLRIRGQDRTISPFDGVVKVEKVLIGDEEEEYGLDSSEIDMISANIINERNPVCYGKDKRWANHLYPIYLTESFIKSQYLSESYFLNLF